MLNKFKDINARMQKYPRVFFACGIFLCLAAGYAEVVSGPQWNVAALYLFPVLWVAAAIGLIPGLCLIAVSVTLSIIAGHHAGSLSLVVSNALVLVFFFTTTVLLTNRLMLAQKKERDSSRHDPLTKAYNAKAFYGVLEVEAHRCRRYSRPLTIAYIDCDDFHQINERYGNHMGDEFLKLTSDIVRRGLRLTDTFARLNGDEFAVILPETHNRDAKNIFLRIRKALSEDMGIRELNGTFSMGVATFLSPPSELKDMVEKANALMRDVKNNGKNMVNAEVFGASNNGKGQS